MKKNNQVSVKTSNNFKISEWSGAFGDLGTLIPLAFALMVFNNFSPSRLLLLWGIVYIITGLYFKIPVSVQPLKAMSVIAIASSIPASMLSVTAFYYGIILIFLSVTGIINKLQKLFSSAITKGIQLGVGLILAKKAVELLYSNGLFIQSVSTTMLLNICLFSILLILFWFLQFKKQIPLSLILVTGSVVFVILFFPNLCDFNKISPPLIEITTPKLQFLANAFVILIIPQLPLTLGNAVFAANDAAHTLFGKQAKKVTPKKLCTSIGISNVVIGILGGFPICHGSGGIAAHNQFGGKTGGTTIILGTVLVALAVFNPLTVIIFLIPVPILSAMLFYDSIRMCTFTLNLQSYKEIFIATVIGLISFGTKNLTAALIAGLAIEYLSNKISIETKEKEAI
jgi:SulP family sulfate permease